MSMARDLTNARRVTLVAAELALVALTIAVTISLERLFTDTSYIRELAILVLGSHLVSAACRRAELSMAWATPISAAALVVLGTAVFYPEASALILPTAETATTLGEDLREAWRVFSDDAAPVPPIRGFVVATSVLMWYGVFLADWAAFRLRSPLEAVAPATAVFVFGSLLGVDRNEIAHGLLFSGGLLLVLLTMRAERQAREEVWVANGAAAGVRTTLQIGAAVGLVAVVLAGILAPRLPGATAQPILDITELNNGPEPRSVLSPLVEVSASLVEQTDTELFSVRVEQDQQDYWRLMALTKFEDEIWRRSSEFAEARGPIGVTTEQRVDTETLTQEITIAALGNIYLPAAYEVSNVIDDGGVDLQHEFETGALVVASPREIIPRGLTYTIESEIPDYTPSDLPARAADGLDPGFVREHTQLPPVCGPDEDTASTGCWPAGVTAEAERIVTEAGATTDHQRALALQAFFLDPTRFAYDIDVALDHNIADMNTFLTIGRGYCEQFASTFAAMARSLGIPTRVAVGFTWGDWDPERAEYLVSGKHAHAWPEIYFADTGWIVFDPTPGRSRGHDGDITNLPTPQQSGVNDTLGVAPQRAPDGPATTTGPNPTDSTPQAAPTTVPRTPATGTDAGGADSSEPGKGRSVWPFLVGLVGVLALVAFVPIAQGIRRRRRLSRLAADPIGRAEMAWDDARGALRLLGITSHSHQTPYEFAAAVEKTRREVGPIRELAAHVTRLRYSTAADAASHAQLAHAASMEIVRQCRAQVGSARVIREAIDPRSLLLPPPAPLVTQ